MRILTLIIALLLFTISALAQPAGADLTINGDAVTIQTGSEAAPARVRVAVSAGQHVQLIGSRFNPGPFIIVHATLSDGTYLGYLSTHYLPSEVGEADFYVGPVYLEQDGVIEYTIYAESDPVDIKVSAIAIEPVLMEIGDAVTVPLAGDAGTYIAFPARINDRVDIVLESALDTEMVVISQGFGEIYPRIDGPNDEIIGYWTREDGYEYIYIYSANGEAGNVKVRVFNNPIPDVTLYGTVITFVPNETPAPMFRLRYTAGTDNVISVQTVDGAPTGDIYIDIFRNGEFVETIIGNSSAQVNYIFHASEDGEIVFTVGDELYPTNEYLISGGAIFRG